MIAPTAARWKRGQEGRPEAASARCPALEGGAAGPAPGARAAPPRTHHAGKPAAMLRLPACLPAAPNSTWLTPAPGVAVTPICSTHVPILLPSGPPTNPPWCCPLFEATAGGCGGTDFECLPAPMPPPRLGLPLHSPSQRMPRHTLSRNNQSRTHTALCLSSLPCLPFPHSSAPPCCHALLALRSPAAFPPTHAPHTVSRWPRPALQPRGMQLLCTGLACLVAQTSHLLMQGLELLFPPLFPPPTFLHPIVGLAPAPPAAVTILPTKPPFDCRPLAPPRTSADAHARRRLRGRHSDRSPRLIASTVWHTVVCQQHTCSPAPALPCPHGTQAFLVTLLCHAAAVANAPRGTPAPAFMLSTPPPCTAACARSQPPRLSSTQPNPTRPQTASVPFAQQLLAGLCCSYFRPTGCSVGSHPPRPPWAASFPPPACLHPTQRHLMPPHCSPFARASRSHHTTPSRSCC
jgi:hypothetical protein